MIWILGLVALALALVMVFGALWVIRLEDKWAQKFIADYQESFPGKCPICGFHRWGIDHGFERPGSKPDPHPCPEGADPRD